MIFEFVSMFASDCATERKFEFKVFSYLPLKHHILQFVDFDTILPLIGQDDDFWMSVIKNKHVFFKDVLRYSKLDTVPRRLVSYLQALVGIEEGKGAISNFCKYDERSAFRWAVENDVHRLSKFIMSRKHSNEI